MSKHTPGPWCEYTEMGVHAIYAQAPNRPDRIVVATVDFYNEEANARLIAAAPDMAEALRSIAESGWNAGDMGTVRAIARAALAKAGL